MALHIHVRRAGILRNIRLDLPSTGVTLVVGPNGAGKTTLLKTIAGIVRADAEIVLDGVRLHELPPQDRRIGYVPQGLALFRHMSVYDNIAYGLRARRLPESLVRDRVEGIAALMGISHLLDRMPWQLSGGERQRVALARALVVDARLLLLDEAFDHIDEETRIELMRLVSRESLSRGIPVIMVTHHPGEAKRHMSVKAVVRLRGGRLESLEKIVEAMTICREKEAQTTPRR